METLLVSFIFQPISFITASAGKSHIVLPIFKNRALKILAKHIMDRYHVDLITRWQKGVGVC
jgi:hypothetical protein